MHLAHRDRELAGLLRALFVFCDSEAQAVNAEAAAMHRSASSLRAATFACRP
jgi:hypothetical protein